LFKIISYSPIHAVEYIFLHGAPISLTFDPTSGVYLFSGDAPQPHTSEEDLSTFFQNIVFAVMADPKLPKGTTVSIIFEKIPHAFKDLISPLLEGIGDMAGTICSLDPVSIALLKDNDVQTSCLAISLLIPPESSEPLTWQQERKAVTARLAASIQLPQDIPDSSRPFQYEDTEFTIIGGFKDSATSFHSYTLFEGSSASIRTEPISLANASQHLIDLFLFLHGAMMDDTMQTSRTTKTPILINFSMLGSVYHQLLCESLDPTIDQSTVPTAFNPDAARTGFIDALLNDHGVDCLIFPDRTSLLFFSPLDIPLISTVYRIHPAEAPVQNYYCSFPHSTGCLIIDKAPCLTVVMHFDTSISSGERGAQKLLRELHAVIGSLGRITTPELTVKFYENSRTFHTTAYRDTDQVDVRNLSGFITSPTFTITCTQANPYQWTLTRRDTDFSEPSTRLPDKRPRSTTPPNGSDPDDMES
jgi:hypothetical protein